MRDPVNRIFDDDVMIGFAVVLALTIIPPSFFDFSPSMLILFGWMNYLIIAVFVAEYILKLFVAESRFAYIMNLWHILDLIIILIALLDVSRLGIVPIVISGEGRASPVLRLLRVLLAFTLASRTVERVRPIHDKRHDDPARNLMVSTFDGHSNIGMCSTEELSCSYLTKNEPLWVDMQNVARKDLDLFTEASTIPKSILESKLIRESFPRIENFKDVTTILLWDSRIDQTNSNNSALNIKKNDMLVVCFDSKIITLSKGNSDLFERISGKQKELPLENGQFAIRILYSILLEKINDYGEIVQSIERRTIDLEDIPVNKTSPQFLEDTFYFKKEIQKTISNLWHFKQVLENIKLDKVAIEGLNDDHKQFFNILYDESEYMYETAQNIKDSLISLIDLHINTVGYDMNKVMKVIAVITCLGLIPGIIGGLLGENLMNEPYPITIQEVFFIVFSLMALGIYIFFKKGWLR